MRKSGRLLLLGAAPLAAGYIYDALMTALPLYGLPGCAVGLGLLLLWGYGAYRLAGPGKGPAGQALLICAPGLVMLALALFQELALGRYWGNFMGTAPQTFFLPLLALASTAFSRLFALFTPTLPAWPFYIAAWLFLFAAAWAGCRKKRRG